MPILLFKRGWGKKAFRTVCTVVTVCRRLVYYVLCVLVCRCKPHEGFKCLGLASYHWGSFPFHLQMGFLTVVKKLKETSYTLAILTVAAAMSCFSISLGHCWTCLYVVHPIKGFVSQHEKGCAYGMTNSKSRDRPLYIIFLLSTASDKK